MVGAIWVKIAHPLNAYKLIMYGGRGRRGVGGNEKSENSIDATIYSIELIDFAYHCGNGALLRLFVHV